MLLENGNSNAASSNIPKLPSAKMLIKKALNNKGSGANTTNNNSAPNGTNGNHNASGASQNGKKRI